MNNKINNNTFLFIAGFVILGIFTYVSVLNILPNNSSGSYFSKNDNILASINSLEYENGKINVYVNEDNVDVCVKQTKSYPAIDSICWKTVNNNYTSFSAFEDRKYYIWLKDSNNNIGDYIEFMTKSN